MYGNILESRILRAHYNVFTVDTLFFLFFFLFLHLILGEFLGVLQFKLRNFRLTNYVIIIYEIMCNYIYII